MPKIVKKIRVKNRLGVHARPATNIVKLLQSKQSKVWISHKEQCIDARSIISILMLALTKNMCVDLIVEGEDAQETMQELEHLFETGFGELEAITDVTD